ncbi:serine carboxypeptidase-like 17 [Panicum virgatum]|uniref:Uncharacterized protein n=1 Tax=Panicum virgatum TaxID=38727 RepID=A0A8T0UMS1_PANVG|nr:serine carboxypeptidase-like 17 [Panicum virgatum]KAG2622073.1 hypothetical protein PVAP13_3NG287200 [Panicum virgatum]
MRLRHRRLSSPPLTPLLASCLLLLLLPLPRAAATTVVTRLPGFHGPLPFYLETGYVGVEEETGAELFYYFVESERSPGTDPVLVWLTGGPRCSAFSGLAYEIGPVKFVLEPYDGTLPRLVYSPDSWTRVASIIFLDSPVGSGFSYARDPRGYDVGDVSSSRQVVTFLRKWFDAHPWLQSNPFYVAGDSYAGKMVPVIAQYISEGNEGMHHSLINLKGYIVGNPVTGDQIDTNSRIPYAHSHGIISDQQYEAAVANCNGDYVSPTNKLCADVLQTIHNLMSEVDYHDILGPTCPRDSLNPRRDALARKSLAEEHYYRISDPPAEPSFRCFEYRYYLSYFWANDNATRAALGIKEGTVKEWVRCCKRPGFPYTYDIPSSIKYHFNLTTRGYRALVYSGDHDLVIPFSGTQAWIRSYNFSIVDDWRAWHLDGQAAGFTIKYANNLTFATVKGGRHEAPGNRPKECFAMAKRWLDNKPL